MKTTTTARRAELNTVRAMRAEAYRNAVFARTEAWARGESGADFGAAADFLRGELAEIDSALATERVGRL
jgi:hypothetical protein